MNKRILIVEDQVDIAELVAMHIRDLGIEATTCHNGREGLQLAQTENWAALILDVMLPDMDGLAIVRQLRFDRNPSPVLMLTAKSTEIDRVLGLELGADDYLTKPFSIPELQARVKALLRRAEIQEKRLSDETSGLSQKPIIKLGGLQIDTESHQVTLDNAALPLTSKEYDLLLYFAKAPGRVFTRTQLLEAIWSTSYEGYEHNVNTHINRLRAKLEVDPTNPRYVLTVRGVGYRFMNHEGR